MNSQILENELKRFEMLKGEYKATHPNGGFLVIKGDEVLGIWNDRSDALKAGIEKYGDVQFLVDVAFHEIAQLDELFC
jgi:hypothetical protein